MDVSSKMVGVTNSSNQPEKKSNASELGADQFMQLLLFQMKNQDPTAPMDATQQLAQLAQFTSLEQQTKTNGKLDALINGTSLAQADGFIGRSITSADGSVTGTVESVRIFSDGLVAKLSDGREVVIEPGLTVAK